MVSSFLPTPTFSLVSNGCLYLKSSSTNFLVVELPSILIRLRPHWHEVGKGIRGVAWKERCLEVPCFGKGIGIVPLRQFILPSRPFVKRPGYWRPSVTDVRRHIYRSHILNLGSSRWRVQIYMRSRNKEFYRSLIPFECVLTLGTSGRCSFLESRATLNRLLYFGWKALHSRSRK